MSEMNGSSRTLISILGMNLRRDVPVTLILESGLEVDILIQSIGIDGIIRGTKAEGVTGGQHFQLSKAGSAAIKLDTVIGVIQPIQAVPSQRQERDQVQ